MKPHEILLGVNIDHVATLRQARGTTYPDPIYAAQLAEQAGADGITLHLREDRRHIQDDDLFYLHDRVSLPVNLELAVTQEMLAIAEQAKPQKCCFVPERRQELTTEGGLDVVGNLANVQDACQRLGQAGIEVSLFIDPELSQIDAALKTGAPVIEIHTGCYADAVSEHDRDQELTRIRKAVAYAADAGLIVNAGHGLHYQNVSAIAAMEHIHELNIGHSIVAQAVFVGFVQAVADMKDIMVKARLGARD